MPGGFEIFSGFEPDRRIEAGICGGLWDDAGLPVQDRAGTWRIGGLPENRKRLSDTAGSRLCLFGTEWERHSRTIAVASWQLLLPVVH
jgi:hypothetical protein